MTLFRGSLWNTDAPTATQSTHFIKAKVTVTRLFTFAPFLRLYLKSLSLKVQTLWLRLKLYLQGKDELLCMTKTSVHICFMDAHTINIANFGDLLNQ